jgi:predicted dehydrogenase
MLRLALLGTWHVHAKDHAADALAHPGTELVAVWDDDPERGPAFAAERGLPFEPDLGVLLAKEDVDALTVTSATTAHEALIGAALAAGKHVFTEKPLALGLATARRLADHAQAAGRVLGVSLVRQRWGTTLVMRELIATGAIGTPTAGRVRVAHPGAVPTPEHPDGWLPPRFLDPAEAGGGALADLGAHPLYLLRLLLGMPERVSAAGGHVSGRPLEDNGVALLAYTGGALGVAETGFVSRGPFSAVEINGTEGNLLLSPLDGKLWLRGAGEEGWREVAVPPDGPTPFAAWVDAVGRGEADAEQLALALDLSALMEALARSMAEGRTVALAELAS